ncbi:hypothetical protein ABG067_001718 [Albugo candida]|uniref:non-specific serine/threonine protein kinase n=1 Tax=Albugo candida TaxID=65357 RepID=A0A024FYQ2_9STRA|nr:unnamed protein product [Albugo candida]|eukprot:CCI39719.1 unnamed protein product [Albugo candida]
MLLSQGAEAKLYRSTFGGRDCVIKERIAKPYRLAVLDRKLSHRRLIQEVRCLMKCKQNGVATPSIYLVDENNGRIYFEFVSGSTLKEFLCNEHAKGGCYPSEALEIAYKTGAIIAKMHEANIVHGDLTTSNVLQRCPGKTDVVLIDFGLASSNPLPEDKAVDLYVMERAFHSTHIECDALMEEVLRAYRKHYSGADAVFAKLTQVRLRGRKRTMLG